MQSSEGMTGAGKIYSQSESLKWLASCFCLPAGSLGSSACDSSHKVLFECPCDMIDGFPQSK